MALHKGTKHGHQPTVFRMIEYEYTLSSCFNYFTDRLHVCGKGVYCVLLVSQTGYMFVVKVYIVCYLFHRQVYLFHRQVTCLL